MAQTPRNASPTGEIQHRSLDGVSGQFFIDRLDGQRVAELTYAMAGDDVVVSHTWVDPAFRGGPYARMVVDAAVEWARRERYLIVPRCSYVRSVFERHPERYADVRAPVPAD